MIRYKFKEFITEKLCNDLIDNLFKEKNKSLLISPMKSGKTTFIFTQLHEKLKEKKMQLIFVSPKVTLLDQLDSKYNVGKCYGKRSSFEIKEDIAVITTPDSLLKVINKCQDLKKNFFIVYDEAHELELSYNFRKKLAYPVKYYNHSLCCGLLCMSATPDNIYRSMEWDNVFLIDIENKFIQTKLTNIVTGLDGNAETIANYIIKFHEEDNTTKVIRINNKATIKKVAEILLKVANIEVKTWYRSREEDNEKGDLHLQKVLEGAKLENEIILTTSLVDVGVEIYSEVKPIVISFMDLNSSVIEEIQFIGRFRDGVKEFNLIVPNTNLISEFKTYAEIQEKLYKKYNELCALANEYDIEDKTLYKNLIATKDHLGIYSYEIDPIAVNSEVFEKYMRQIVKKTNILRKYLTNHLTFNSEVIRIVNINQNQLNNNDNVAQVGEEIKAEEEKLKQEFEIELKALREKTKLLDTGQTKVLLYNSKDLDLLTIHDKEILKTIEEEYIFYHSEDMIEYRKRYYDLQDLTKKQCTEQQLLLNILDDKWYKDFKLQDQYITANRKFNKGFQADQDSKLEIKIYAIRNEIIKIKGKEKNIRLSDKFKGDLIEVCKKNKCFSKVTIKTLEKHLRLIYNTDENIVRSAKTKTLV